MLRYLATYLCNFIQNDDLEITVVSNVTVLVDRASAIAGSRPRNL